MISVNRRILYISVAGKLRIRASPWTGRLASSIHKRLVSGLTTRGSDAGSQISDDAQNQHGSKTPVFG